MGFMLGGGTAAGQNVRPTNIPYQSNNITDKTSSSTPNENLKEPDQKRYEPLADLPRISDLPDLTSMQSQEKFMNGMTSQQAYD